MVYSIDNIEISFNGVKYKLDKDKIFFINETFDGIVLDMYGNNSTVYIYSSSNVKSKLNHRFNIISNINFTIKPDTHEFKY